MTLSLPCSRWGTQEPVSLHPDIIGSQPPTRGAEQRGFCAACYSNHSALTPATAREGEAASGFGGVPRGGLSPMPLTEWYVVAVRAVRRLAAAPALPGAPYSYGISVFMEIKQQISCGITTSMGRAAMPPGLTGRNGHARPGAEAGTRPGAEAGSA